MTTERVCRDCGERIAAADDAPTVLDDPGLCDRCSAETAQSPDTPADQSRRTRWIAVAVGLAGVAVALIGVTIARKHTVADQASGADDYGYGDDAADDDFDDFGGFWGGSARTAETSPGSTTAPSATGPTISRWRTESAICPPSASTPA